ncbi:MAG: hypothetical protein JXR96_04615 [Deltaproteobacteria bacterium]|nr:hypothetical protein [Deltaproteobacteria bacterium]
MCLGFHQYGQLGLDLPEQLLAQGPGVVQEQLQEGYFSYACGIYNLGLQQGSATTDEVLVETKGIQQELGCFGHLARSHTRAGGSALSMRCSDQPDLVSASPAAREVGAAGISMSNCLSHSLDERSAACAKRVQKLVAGPRIEGSGRARGPPGKSVRALIVGKTQGFGYLLRPLREDLPACPCGLFSLYDRDHIRFCRALERLTPKKRPKASPLLIVFGRLGDLIFQCLYLSLAHHARRFFFLFASRKKNEHDQQASKSTYNEKVLRFHGPPREAFWETPA